MITKYFSPQTKTKNDIVVERIVVVVVIVVGSIDSNRFGIKETMASETYKENSVSSCRRLWHKNFSAEKKGLRQIFRCTITKQKGSEMQRTITTITHKQSIITNIGHVNRNVQRIQRDHLSSSVM